MATKQMSHVAADGTFTQTVVTETNKIGKKNKRKLSVERQQIEGERAVVPSQTAAPSSEASS